MPRALRQISRLQDADRRTIEQALSRLGTDFGSSDVRKLGGRHDEWRLRVGTLRARLRLENSTGVIQVLSVLPRGRAYRR